MAAGKRLVIAGGDAEYADVVGTAITRVFELAIGRTGLTEREAREAGFDAVATLLESSDRAGYMPDHQDLILKFVAEVGSGRLLGGQVLGRDRVAQRVDLLATALHAGLTLDVLTGLDLAYAPPLNSVWDPVQVATTKLLWETR